MKSKVLSRIGDTFSTPLGGTLTIIGVDYSCTVSRSYKHLVTCSICSKDKELFPEPFPVLYAKLKNGQCPCACSPYTYNDAQTEILIRRKCLKLNHTFKGFIDEFRGLNKTKMKYDCPHREGNTDNCYHYIYYIKHGCSDCSSDNLAKDKLSDITPPDNVIDMKSEPSVDKENRNYYYRCQYCSFDWFVENHFCDGWFKFLPHRLSNMYLSCRCNTKYHGGDDYRKGKAIKAQLHNEHLEVTGVDGDRVDIICKIHGKISQDYSSCCEGRIPLCCTQTGWNIIKGREKEKDNLYILSVYNGCSKYIKIGRSFDIRRRQDEIEEGCETELLFFLQTHHEEICKYEKFFHKIFSKYAQRPEFEVSGYSEFFSKNILEDPDFKLFFEITSP